MRTSQKGPGILIPTQQGRGDGRSAPQQEKEARIVSGFGCGFSSSFPSDGWHLPESSAKGVREDVATVICVVQRHIQKRGKDTPGNLEDLKNIPCLLNSSARSGFLALRNAEPIRVPVLGTLKNK